MDKNTKIIIGAGLLGLLLWKAASGSGERRYRLPDGRIVPESQLANAGYVFINGRWVPVDALNQAEGTNRSPFDWQQLINAGQAIWQQYGDDFLSWFGNLFGGNPDDIILDPNRDLYTGWA